MVDGGKGGGEQILHVFEKRLTDNIRKLDFDKILDPANVRRIVEEADGYQPHLIAPEMGYRRLLQVGLFLVLSANVRGTRWRGRPLCALLAMSAPAWACVLALGVCSWLLPAVSKSILHLRASLCTLLLWFRSVRQMADGPCLTSTTLMMCSPHDVLRRNALSSSRAHLMWQWRRCMPF